MEITVKQAKTVPLIQLTTVVLGLIAMLVAMGFTINELVKSYDTKASTNILLCWFGIVALLACIALAVGAMAEVCIAIIETYTFTDDRLIKKYKKKVKFEIPYSNINTFEIDKLFLMGWALTIHCKEPFVKYGIDKNLKRVGGYFNKGNLDRIQEKIVAFNVANGDSIKINFK